MWEYCILAHTHPSYPLPTSREGKTPSTRGRGGYDLPPVVKIVIFANGTYEFHSTHFTVKKISALLIILLPFAAFSQKSCTGEAYKGKDRKAAKTSIALSSKVEDFKTLDELILTLPSDNFMRNLHPPITKDPNSLRVQEENRNVSVESAYLFAIYRENDNDFHVIIGSTPDADSALLMNFEISGLPHKTELSYPVFKEVRKKVKDYFGNVCKKKTILTVNPVHVSIEGSLFFDVDHPAGQVGPGKLKPKTSWEVHPVTDIIFLN